MEQSKRGSKQVFGEALLTLFWDAPGVVIIKKKIQKDKEINENATQHYWNSLSIRFETERPQLT